MLELNTIRNTHTEILRQKTEKIGEIEISLWEKIQKKITNECIFTKSGRYVFNVIVRIMVNV